MTKKFFSVPSSESEFLVAVPARDGFVSIKTGASHSVAMVVYTGTDLTSEMVVGKAKANGIDIATGSAEYTLTNVTNFKVGSRVTHGVINGETTFGESS